MTARRGLAVAAAGLLACWPGCAPPARALTPPPVDHTLLPPAAHPRPPAATTQREVCTVPRPRARDAPPVATARVTDRAALWRLSRGDGQRVAVIDTGVARHPRLPRLEGGGDYVADGDGTVDCDAHGTIVAGIIAAAVDPDDTSGFAGLAPGATLVSLRQTSTKFAPTDDPAADGVGDVDTLAAAVRTAADLGASVINISSVACAAGPLNDGSLGAALAYAVDVKDAVVVSAAGNVGGPGRCPRPGAASASAQDSWDSATVAVSPAWYDDYVLTVAAVDAEGTPAEFTLAGPWVDVAAPGEDVVSLSPTGAGLVDALPALGREAPISGTSYAAPVVSALAALVRARFPELTAREVTQRIEATAQRAPGGWNPYVGNGVVDPLAALGTEPPAPPPAPAARPVPAPAAGTNDTAGPGRRAAGRTALAGTAMCAAVLVALLAATRRRSPRVGAVTGEQGGLPAQRGTGREQ